MANRDVEAQESKMAQLTKQSYEIAIKLRDLEVCSLFHCIFILDRNKIKKFKI